MTTAPPPALPAAPKPPRRLLLGAAVIIAASGGATYLALGRLDGWALQAPPPPPTGEVGALAASLAQRVRAAPGDHAAWELLARAELSAGNPAGAVAAMRRVIALRPNDAQALLDGADLLGVLEDASLEGQRVAWVERALAVAPGLRTVRLHAGTLAIERHRYDEAVEHLERALALSGPADDDDASAVRSALAEARRLAGQAPAQGASAAAR